MRENSRIIFSLLAVIVAGFCAFAQQFTLMAPQRVFKGEKFAVTYRLTNAQGANHAFRRSTVVSFFSDRASPHVRAIRY